MRFVLPEDFGGDDEPVAHALFCEKDDPKMEKMICRNSWGSKNMHIPIPYNANFILGLYCVRIEDLIRCEANDNGYDETLLKNFVSYKNNKKIAYAVPDDLD